MKKIVTILLILLILFTAACGLDAPATPTPSPEPTVAPTPKPTYDPSGDNGTNPPSPGEEISAAEILDMQSDARWLFEQQFLPMVVLEFHQEVIDFINDFNEAEMEMFLLWAWEYVASIVVEYELGDRFALLDANRPLESIGMGDAHIANVAIEQLDDDILAAIVKMLDIGEVRRSTYIGIVYTADSELRMFTLEESYGFHMFCFIGVEARGSFFAVENDRDAFIGAILEVLETQMEAAGGVIWSR